MRIGDVGIVTTFELRRMFRSAHGLLTLVFGALVFGYTAKALYGLAGELLELGPLDLNGDIGDANPLYMLLSFWMDSDVVDKLGRLLSDHPPIVTAWFVIALFFTSFVTVLASIDQTASDISTRHLRFLLLRTDRVSLYVGKTLAVWAFVAIFMTAMTLVIGATIIAAGGAPGFTTGEIVIYLLRILATVVVYSLPFVTLAGFASASTGHPALAAVVVFGYWIVIAIASTLGAVLIDALEVVKYGFPTALKYDLVFADPGMSAAALSHMLGLGVLFFVLGLLIFRKRDV